MIEYIFWGFLIGLVLQFVTRAIYNSGYVRGYYDLLRRQGRTHESAMDKIRYDLMGEDNGER
jgi:hypothetical protein